MLVYWRNRCFLINVLEIKAQNDLLLKNNNNRIMTMMTTVIKIFFGKMFLDVDVFNNREHLPIVFSFSSIYLQCFYSFSFYSSFIVRSNNIFQLDIDLEIFKALLQFYLLHFFFKSQILEAWKLIFKLGKHFNDVFPMETV